MSSRGPLTERSASPRRQTYVAGGWSPASASHRADRTAFRSRSLVATTLRARSVSPVASAWRTVAGPSLLSNDILNRHRLARGCNAAGGRHYRPAPLARHPRQAWLLVASTADTKLELAIGVVVSVAPIDDRCTDEIGPGL